MPAAAAAAPYFALAMYAAASSALVMPDATLWRAHSALTTLPYQFSEPRL